MCEIMHANYELIMVSMSGIVCESVCVFGLGRARGGSRRRITIEVTQLNTHTRVKHQEIMREGSDAGDQSLHLSLVTP